MSLSPASGYLRNGTHQPFIKWEMKKIFLQKDILQLLNQIQWLLLSTGFPQYTFLAQRFPHSHLRAEEEWNTNPSITWDCFLSLIPTAPGLSVFSTFSYHRKQHKSKTSWVNMMCRQHLYWDTIYLFLQVSSCISVSRGRQWI